jgi:hypothetical protein
VSIVDLTKTDWDIIEKIIEDALNRMLRTYDGYKYLIIDSNTLLVKVYEDNELIFTIKFRVYNEKLEVLDAS